MHELRPAYVLHSRRFRESSLVVELLTASQGRVAVLAKGALGGTHKAYRLRPFSPLLVDWRGRGELPLLTHAEPSGRASDLQGRALYCGLYINELVLRLTQRADPHCQLFEPYIQCVAGLAALRQDNAYLEPLLRRFELELLQELGQGLQLQVDQNGRSIAPDQRYHYDAQDGAQPVSGGTDSIAGSSLLSLAEGRLNDATARREVRELLRRILAQHLGGVELRSRDLFR